jgi:hypothetical protein
MERHDMRLTFIPQWGRPEPVMSVAGDVLTINGAAFDFGALPDGATLPRAAVDCDWLASDVERIDGVVQATVIAHLDDTAALDQPEAPWMINTTDGPLILPVVRREQPEDKTDDD